MTHAHPTKSRFTRWTAAAPLGGTGVLRALPQGTLAVPDRLTGLTALDHDTVNLTWSHPDEAKVDHYRVLRRTKDQRWPRRIGTTQTTSFQDDGLQPETMYIYRVAAVDSDGGARPPHITAKQSAEEVGLSYLRHPATAQPRQNHREPAKPRGTGSSPAQ